MECVCVLGLFGDLIMIDYISFVGVIKWDSLVGDYLIKKKVKCVDFNLFGLRWGNYEVMMCGIFGNIWIKNEMVFGVEGGVIVYYLSGK